MTDLAATVRAALATAHPVTGDDHDAVDAADAALAELVRLAEQRGEALAKYGRHRAGCLYQRGCTCGYGTALADDRAEVSA